MTDTFITPNESPAPPFTKPLPSPAQVQVPTRGEDVPALTPYARALELAQLDEHVTGKLLEDRDCVIRVLEELYDERERRESIIRRLEEIRSRLERAAISTRGDDEPQAAVAFDSRSR